MISRYDRNIGLSREAAMQGSDEPGLIHKKINRESLKRKVFCIGLHRQGTTSLAALASCYGYDSNHSTRWFEDRDLLRSCNFFSDGGSHYDNINEFPYEWLASEYPDSLFILQTRDPVKWLLSKLVHAGWTEATEPIDGDPGCEPDHRRWREQSLLNIDRFLLHKRNYECKVRAYFQARFPHRLLVIDITDPACYEDAIRRLEAFLGVQSVAPMQMPHRNRSRPAAGGVVSKDVHDYVVQKVEEIFGPSIDQGPGRDPGQALSLSSPSQVSGCD